MSKGVYNTTVDLLRYVKKQDELIRLMKLYIAILETEMKVLKENSEKTR